MAPLKLHPKVFFPLLFLVVWSLSWTSAAYPQTGSKSAAPEEPLPLNITADRLEVEQNQQVITFIKNVVARYKDMILYADLLKIFYQSKTEAAPAQEKRAGKPKPAGQGAPALPAAPAQEKSPPQQCPPGQEASASPAAKSKNTPSGSEASPLGAVGIEKITRIEALGKVRIVQGDRVATGDKAIYYTQEEKIVLMGNPQLWRGENSLKGHEIVFYVQENRAVVESEPSKRVEAVIYPSQKVQLPGSKPPAAAPPKK
jgi:lipopolysaccharide export system protein LptA